MELLLTLILLGSAGYLMYSTYQIYSKADDTVIKETMKQTMMIQAVQMLFIIGLLYSVATSTKATPSMY
jgi:hypothetical protein